LKIFLGGTCPSFDGDFDYRKILIPILNELDIEYFNPVVEDWTEECIKIEEDEKELCDIHLYLIAPNMKGVYSVAEAFGSLMIYDEEKMSILLVLKSISDKTFEKSQLKSLYATLDLFESCGGSSWNAEDINSLNEDFLLEILEGYY